MSSTKRSLNNSQKAASGSVQVAGGRKARGARSGGLRQAVNTNSLKGNKPQVVEERTEEIRQCITSGVKKLHLHDLSFTGQDLLLNNDGFPHLRDGDIVQIFQPNAPERKFTLTVKWLSSVTEKTNTRLQVSLLKSVAEAFGLQSFCEIQLIGPIDPANSNNEISFVEFHFKDQFVSRADLWRFTNEVTANVPAHKGKMFNLVGTRAKVEELRNSAHRTVESGVLSSKTKVVFRSRSTRIFWLVQMSIEMWQPHDSSGELYFERFINGFVRPVLQRWRNDETAHSVSVVFFTRTWISEDEVNSLDCTLQKDFNGRVFRDYYKMVLENQDLTGMASIIHKLKEEFILFPQQVGIQGKYKGIPCPAAQGNVLESLNLTLNILDKHHMDRDLTRTGNSIVMVTPSNGVLRVHEKLSKVTKQRMMDNGIGMDMISLGARPLHTVPIFIHRTQNQKEKFEMPYWMNLSYLSRRYLVRDLRDGDDDQKKEATTTSTTDSTANAGTTPASNAPSSSAAVSSSSSSVTSNSGGNTPTSSSASTALSMETTSSGLGLDGDIGSSTIDPERGRFGFGGDAIEFAGGLLPQPKGVRTDNGVKLQPHKRASIRIPPALVSILKASPLLQSIQRSEEKANQHHVKDKPISDAPRYAFTNRDKKNELCPKPIIAAAVRNSKGELMPHAPRPILGHLKDEPSGLSSLLSAKDAKSQNFMIKSNSSPQSKSLRTSAALTPPRVGVIQQKSAIPSSQVLSRSKASSPSRSPSSSHSRSWESGCNAASAFISQSNSPMKRPPLPHSNQGGASSYGADPSHRNVVKTMTSEEEPEDEEEALVRKNASEKEPSIEDQMDEFDDCYWAGAFEVRHRAQANSFGSGGRGSGNASLKRDKKSSNSLEERLSSHSLDSSPSDSSLGNGYMYVGSDGGRLSEGNGKPSVAMVPEATVMVQSALSKQSNQSHHVGPGKSKPSPTSRDSLLPEPQEPPTPVRSTVAGYERRFSNYMANVAGSMDSGYALNFGSSISPENYNYFPAPPRPAHVAQSAVAPANTSNLNIFSRFLPDTRRLHSQQQQQPQHKLNQSAAVPGSTSEESNEFVNPFKVESEESLRHRKTHDTRRWSHNYVFDEQHDFSKSKKLGLNYKSLSTPAVLPLTTDCVPHLRELESERYSQRPDPVALPQDSIADSSYHRLVREMVMQRLACDFQLTDSDEAGDSDSGTLSLNSMQRRVTTLTVGHRIHRIEVSSPFTHVKVTEYTSVLVSKANEATNISQMMAGVSGVGSSIQNKKAHSESMFRYRYMNWDRLTCSFQLMEQGFQQFPDSLAWNSIDQLIVTPLIHLDPYPMRARNTRYKRILFVVIPNPSPMTNSEVRAFFESRFKLSWNKPKGLKGTSAPSGVASSSLSSLSNRKPSLIPPPTSALASPPSKLASPPPPPPVAPPLPPSVSVPLPPPSVATNSPSSIAAPQVSTKMSTPKSKMKGTSIQSPTSTTPTSTPAPTATSAPSLAPVDLSETFRAQLLKIEAWLNSLKSAGSEVLNIKVGEESHKPVGKTLVTVPFTNKRPWYTGDRIEWALVVPDSEMRRNMCYRIEVNWLLCTGYNVGELVSLLYKQCAKAGLRLAQVPQHTLSIHLSIHSFNGASWMSIPNHTVLVVMELSLRERFLFTPDAKQATDWKLSFPWLNDTKVKSITRPVIGPPMFGEFDPQYIHQKGVAMVRVCCGKGLAWVMNVLRVSDIHLSHSAKSQLCMDIRHGFQAEVEVAMALFDSVIVSLAVLRNRSRQVGTKHIQEANSEPKCFSCALWLWMILQYLDVPACVKEP